MSLFVGHIIRTVTTGEGREGVVSVRGAHRVVVLDAVPAACTGDAVLVEAGVALAVVRDRGRARADARFVCDVDQRCDVGQRSVEGENRPCA
jgi:hydrogenase maturation factor